MKRILFLSLALCMAFGTQAQRRKTTTKKVEVDAIAVATEAMVLYDFDKAIEVLEEKIESANSKRKKEPVVQEEALLEIARKNKMMLAATEVVTFIDSVAMPKRELMNVLKLSDESGCVDSYANYFQKLDSLDCTVFLNQLRNRILFAAPNHGRRLRLYQQELIGGEWKEAEMLQGLVNDEDEDVNYPFLMDDGITLYFGAQRKEGLGGYDIYMTRYDADERTFLTPENVGMPFNSPANDYLMVFDEFNQLGFFVTDRNQPADSICLYTFIPSQTRRIYDEEQTDYDVLRSRARIHSISETWNNEAAVNDAIKRLQTLRSTSSKSQKKKEFEFVVNDKHTYYAISDFRKPEAKVKAKTWKETMQLYTENCTKLDNLRLQYANGDAQVKNQLAPQIRILEKNTEQAYDECKALEIEIRKLELQ